MKRKVISVLMAATLLVAGLTACSGGSDSDSSTSGDSDASAAAGDAVEITIWSPVDEPAIEDWWEEKLAEFNEENEGEIYVTREAIVRSDSYAYEDKINASLTSGDLPDILYVDGPNIASYAANEVIVPIDDYFDDADLDDFVDSIKEQGIYDGSLYALGATESSVALFYNADMFEEAGIRIPESVDDAFTWSEFYEIAETLTTDTVVGTNIIMDQGEGLPYVLQQFWVSNGTNFVSDDGTQADGYINSDAGVEAATFLNDLIQNGYANLDPIENEFHNENAATVLGGSWEVATLENEYPDLNWGVTYFPVADDGTPTSPTGDWAAAITRDAADVDAAGKVVAWLMNEDNVTTYAQAIAKLPTRTSSYDVLTEYDEYPRSLFKEQSLNTGTPRSITPSYTVLSSGFSEAMMNIFTGADVQEELDQLAADYEEDYNSNYVD